MEDIDFVRDGAVRFPAVLTPDAVEWLREKLEPYLEGRPGKRLTGGLSDVIAPVTALAAGLLGGGAFPVRAVAFDKTNDNNWAVAWHQDRTIAVRARIETPGFGPWSTKDGILHVEPPFSVLQGMATLRVHLDDCGDDNAPLRVALGSHRLGLVPAAEAAQAAGHLPQLVCHAQAGDVWAYATPVLHASARSAGGRRRVLQLDYAVAALPGGLLWRGLDRDSVTESP